MPAEQRRAAVLGHPIAHSLSPVLHRAAYASLGLEWQYERIDLTGDGLADFLDGLDASWAGLSLTMPLKAEVLPLVDELDPLARATAAVNTVVLAGGRRHGYNTDVEGLVTALREHGPVAPEPTAGVVGGGATARSAVAALAALGAGSVVACLRRPDAAEDLRATARAVGVGLDVLPWSAAAEALTCDLVVSTVPRGVADVLVPAVPEPAGLLLDVVYDPWPTALATAWHDRGGRVASGLDLLLHQAVEQVRLMTGRKPDVEAMRAALAEAVTVR